MHANIRTSRLTGGNGSPTKILAPQLTAIYNLTMTSAATKSFKSPRLEKRLIAMHRTVDPSTSPRVVLLLLHDDKGNGFTDAHGRGEMSTPYIRVIVDIIAGTKTAEEKAEWLRRIMSCCEEYEGKRAAGCEIEVRMNEIPPDHILRKRPC